MDLLETGKSIAYLRKEKHLTQKELAHMLNISDKAVSKWERGLALPDRGLLARLSGILDTDIESILEGNLTHYDHRWEGILCLEETEDGYIFAGTLVYDKPLVYYMLSYFLLVGITKITPNYSW